MFLRRLAASILFFSCRSIDWRQRYPKCRESHSRRNSRPWVIGLHLGRICCWYSRFLAMNRAIGRGFRWTICFGIEAWLVGNLCFPTILYRRKANGRNSRIYRRSIGLFSVDSRFATSPTGLLCRKSFLFRLFREASYSYSFPVHHTCRCSHIGLKHYGCDSNCRLY